LLLRKIGPAYEKKPELLAGLRQAIQILETGGLRIAIWATIVPGYYFGGHFEKDEACGTRVGVRIRTLAAQKRPSPTPPSVVSDLQCGPFYWHAQCG
jgi:hypothetical protein